MAKKLHAGDTVYGYCGGIFGRDSYNDKRVVAVGQTEGVRWAVLREIGPREPRLLFASGSTLKDLAKNYTTPEPSYDD